MILYSAAAKIKEALSMEYFIPACPGRKINIKRGQRLTITDLEGGQAADFFAVSAEDNGEFLSPAVTLDCHESLKLNAGDALIPISTARCSGSFPTMWEPTICFSPPAARKCTNFSIKTETGTRTALTTSTERRENAFSSSAR